MKNYCWKTILSLLMIVSLFLTMFPLSGLAAPTTGDVNQSSGYVSEIASGSLAGTSFDYMRSQNTPRIEDVGPIDGSVVYVGFACDDSEPVPEATDESDVALVERGDCLFVEKMDNIEGKGYSAVILFNDQRTDNDGCDAFPSSMSTSASIPMLAVYRTTGLQLLGEAGADPVTCPDGPATEASVGTVGERVFISAEFDPESTETGFEQRDGNGWTTLDEEQAFLEMLSEHSERVTYTQEGTSVEGRPIHLVRVGYPEPPSDEEIAAGRNILIMGTPHGNEPAGREMTLKLMRDLAFTEDPELLDQLSEATILFVPTTNPDGREANTRGNAWGIDNNRDHLNLNTPEMETVAKILHEFQPDITVDAHERPSASGNPDIEVLWPRNLNVDEDLRALNVELVQEYMRPDIEDHGFTTGLYGSPGGAGGGDERILRNMAGLRHGLGILTETAGRQDPNYRVEAQMHAAESVLRYYRERFDEIEQAIVESKQKKTAEGADPSQPFYIDGADNWDPTNVLNPKPCGYVIHTSQAESISKHIELFGLETEQVSENGVFVTMNQPMMTVIPFLLDERASYNEVAGLALSDCSDPGAVEPPLGSPSVANLKILTNRLEQEGEFADDATARLLQTHLTAVGLYDDEGNTDKVVKHVESLIQLLDYQKENALISEEAYHLLEPQAESLVKGLKHAFYHDFNGNDGANWDASAFVNLHSWPSNPAGATFSIQQNTGQIVLDKRLHEVAASPNV